MSSLNLTVDRTWTLFLDRDGVINRRRVDDYVRNNDQFEFLPGVLDALRLFGERFGKIIVVSNQQGVGKGLMTVEDVNSVHAFMVNEIAGAGGRVDAVFFCPALESERSFDRKPRIGMALKARKKFPEIRLKKSIMVGDSLSDMVFGRNAGMTTVFISTDRAAIRKGFSLIDFAFPGLIEFAEILNQPETPSSNQKPAV
jgi:histidinol-phosphate phosphatase family protein